MALFALVAPILPGKTEAWKSFMHSLKTTHHAAFLATRKELGVRERTFLQSTPHGDLVIVTLEGENPAAAFGRFASVGGAFAEWMRGEVLAIHGFDLAAPPPGPLPELVIDSGA